MLVDLLVNGIAIAIVYLLYMIFFEDGKISFARLIFAGLFISLLMTRSLKWSNIKALFRGDTGKS
jgi:heme/copper-type cytochrome/quinol oxidase subunit 4